MSRNYDKIYNALLKGKEGDSKWKKTVDKTIKKYLDSGKTQMAAIKAAAMELNTETETVKKAKGVFLKEFSGYDKKRRINAIIDDEVVQILAEDLTGFPVMPARLEITNLERIKYLMTGTIEYRASDKTKFKTSKISPDELYDMAKEIIEIEDGNWALVKGEMIEVACWNKEGIVVTPKGVNIKLNFRSGEVRSGFFLGSLEELRSVLPSPDDFDKFDELVDAQEWDDMLGYVNEICGEAKEIGMPGMEILIYGNVVDNNWNDKQGNERVGKNVRLGGGGFIYSLDILYEGEDKAIDDEDEEDEPAPAPKKKKEKKVAPPEVEEDDDDDDDDDAIGFEPDSAVETPGGESPEEKILAALSEPLSPPELVSAVGIGSSEVAQKLNELMAANKVVLKDGKFVAK